MTGSQGDAHTYYGSTLVERDTTTQGSTTTYRRQSILGTTYLAAGSATTKIVRDPTGNPVAIRQNGTWGYYLRDARQSIIGIVTDTGTITNRYTYTPYGDDTETTTGTPFNNPYRYTSGEQNNTTGYIHYQHRDYDPTLVRFTQPDPANYTDGPNLYTYTNGDPINRTDPTGLGFWDSIGDVGQALAAGFVGSAVGGACEAGALFTGFLATPGCVALGVGAGLLTNEFFDRLDDLASN